MLLIVYTAGSSCRLSVPRLKRLANSLDNISTSTVTWGYFECFGINVFIITYGFFHMCSSYM